jgi:hypothetical protein
MQLAVNVIKSVNPLLLGGGHFADFRSEQVPRSILIWPWEPDYTYGYGMMNSLVPEKEG